MSKALDYLLAVRPDALGPYFAFLKEAGRHLDPKTRALLSVITKVSAQTDTGFRQYLTRALRAGVTPNEVIDALLVSLPMLGFSKIVWAIDLVLQMDIPEFRVSALDVEQRWHRVAPAAAVALEAVARFDCDGRELFIYRNTAGISVYDSRCPHQTTNIPELALHDRCLTCPKHGWVFDVRTGVCVEKGDRPLRRFDSKVEDEQLWAFW